jgi:hypothetical protein
MAGMILCFQNRQLGASPRQRRTFCIQVSRFDCPNDHVYANALNFPRRRTKGHTTAKEITVVVAVRKDGRHVRALNVASGGKATTLEADGEEIDGGMHVYAGNKQIQVEQSQR